MISFQALAVSRVDTKQKGKIHSFQKKLFKYSRLLSWALGQEIPFVNQNGVPGLFLVFLIMFTVSLILESESLGPERVQNFK